jgi:endonuclease I
MKTNTTFLCFFLLTLMSGSLSAQVDIVLFPGSTGDALITQLKANFVPRRVLQYGPARDVMYGDIYNVNDSLSCVYTGHTLYVDPNSDPSTYVFQNGSDNGINAEHTWPRSKGAEFGNALSDMHHLFPTRARANEVRSNFPFGEIDDNETDFWYRKTIETRNKPTSNIDLYSEYMFGTFEPKEAHKGNVARAMFYFYTFYRAEANAADPSFFEKQRATLCNWHYLDPVDDLEYSRTQRIAFYQDQKPNPFVLDCTLAKRLYCADVVDNCSSVLVQTNKVANPAEIDLRILPNPNDGASMVQFDLAKAAQVELVLVNMLGQREQIRSRQRLAKGAYQWDVKIQQKGVYTLLLQINDGQSVRIYPSRMIVN